MVLFKVPEGWPPGSFQEWRSLIFEPNADQAFFARTDLFGAVNRGEVRRFFWIFNGYLGCKSGDDDFGIFLVTVKVGNQDDIHGDSFLETS